MKHKYGYGVNLFRLSHTTNLITNYRLKLKMSKLKCRFKD